MKRLLYLCIILLSFGGCGEKKPIKGDWIWVHIDTDLSEFNGKIISQMIPGDGDQITIVFTDTTRVTLKACSNLKLYK